jgi:hypothetical protein
MICSTYAAIVAINGLFHDSTIDLMRALAFMEVLLTHTRTKQSPAVPGRAAVWQPMTNPTRPFHILWVGAPVGD